jgi:hypothetical protein
MKTFQRKLPVFRKASVALKVSPRTKRPQREKGERIMTTTMIEKNILNTMNTAWTCKRFDVAIRNIVKIDIYKENNILGNGFRYVIDVTDSYDHHHNFDAVMTSSEQKRMEQFGCFETTEHGWRKSFIVTGDDESLLEAMEEMFDIVG